MKISIFRRRRPLRWEVYDADDAWPRGHYLCAVDTSTTTSWPAVRHTGRGPGIGLTAPGSPGYRRHGSLDAEGEQRQQPAGAWVVEAASVGRRRIVPRGCRASWAGQSFTMQPSASATPTGRPLVIGFTWRVVTRSAQSAGKLFQSLPAIRPFRRLRCCRAIFHSCPLFSVSRPFLSLAVSRWEARNDTPSEVRLFIHWLLSVAAHIYFIAAERLHRHRLVYILFAVYRFELQAHCRWNGTSINYIVYC